MSKKILFCSLFILIFLISSKQDSNAKTWKDTTVQADSIIAAIERGDSVIIAGCEISGPLVKKGTPGKPDTIRSLIRIWNSIFYDSVFFSSCCFMNELKFEATSFTIWVFFNDVTFTDRAFFTWSTFEEHAGFWFCTFRESALFWKPTFYGSAGFGETIFCGRADFSYATFSEDAWFLDAIFKEDAIFSEATFRGNTRLRNTTFGGQVDLSHIEFESLDLSWKQLSGHLTCDPPTSHRLMKDFEEKRQLDDADGVYLFLKDQERRHKKWYIRYPEYWFIQQTCGYGTKPLNTLYLSAGIIILFAIFYTKSNAIREIEKELGHRRRRRKYRIVRKGFGKRFYDALYFSVHTFIIGVVSDGYPTDEFLINFWKIKRIKFRTLAMIEGALGWILLVLFVVTLTRKFIR